ILMIAWASKDFETSIAAGRNPALMSQDKVWSEVILEWNPVLDSIVWQWDAWDHLVQDFDRSKANFGNPKNFPELIDLNYDEHDGHPDWLHINSIDYNPVLDQIVLSVPYFNEFWVIDHSTTTAEAASSAGGNSGKGGDLLYRWGNPMTYDAGTEEQQQLFFQHDVQWMNPKAGAGEEDYGKIILYNNRLPDLTSSVNFIATLTNEAYQMEEGVYLPNVFKQTVKHPAEEKRAYSTGLSSAQYLPNGNILVLAGRHGFAYEISPANGIVWNYIVPLKAGRAVNQGDTLSISNNTTFRMTRYGLDDPAFEGRNLTPQGYLELSPNEGFCGLVNIHETIDVSSIKLFPNPAQHSINIQMERQQLIYIYDVLGRRVQTLETQHQQQNIDVSTWQKGVYYLQTEYGAVQQFVVD
ncbi:MAG: T9SS type A sorting domain-containing protein, partial [Bacteroidota bacterium]